MCQDELYIASPEEILHMLQDKYKINIYLQGEYPHDPSGRNILSTQNLEKPCANVNMLFNKDKLAQDLHIAFKIIKLLIIKGNLNLVHNKNTYLY